MNLHYLSSNLLQKFGIIFSQMVIWYNTLEFVITRHKKYAFILKLLYMLLLSLLVRQQRQMQLSMLCYRLFKLLLKSSIWHAHFFSPNNKRAIKHNSCCTWTAHRYLTTSQNCQKHATYCFRAGLYRLYSHNRKWYLQDGQSTQHLFHAKPGENSHYSADSDEQDVHLH